MKIYFAGNPGGNALQRERVNRTLVLSIIFLPIIK